MKLFYKMYRPFERAVLKHAAAIIATSSPYRDSSEPLKKWLSKCHVVPLGVDVERFNCGRNTLWEARPRGDRLSVIPIAENRGETPLPQGHSSHSMPLPQEPASHSMPIPQGRSSHSIPLPQGPASHSTPRLQVLAVGRLTYYKGFSYLIEAAAQAPEIHINLVGHGDQAGHLRTLVASLNLQDRVSFHGILSDAELAQKMADCDCLCLPSIERTEAFGMVLLEAMYFGKATLISDVPGSGMGWIVDDGVTGIKVNLADAGALAEALKRLSTDRDEMIRMGQGGKDKFDQQFEINHAIEGLIKIYQQTNLKSKQNQQ